MKKQIFHHTINLSFLVMILGVLPSCKKFIEVDAPATSTNAAIVYSNDATAASVMTGVYANISSNFSDGGLQAISLYPELSADNLNLVVTDQIQFALYYDNNLESTYANQRVPNFWGKIYGYIYTSNAVLEGVNSSSSLSHAVKQQLLGEAYFVRSLCYFYLVNLFGDVPLVSTTTYTENQNISRSPKEQVYQQIIADLKNAQSHLSDNYLDASLGQISPERVRPNKSVATALLARTYLFHREYTNAEVQASTLIGNNAAYQIIDPSIVFKKNSMETIWALQPVATGINTYDAQFYGISSTGPITNKPVCLSEQLMASFNTEDLRKSHWTGLVTVSGVSYPYPLKYKVETTGEPVTEYSIVMRLAEQYLIRAEARANQGDITGAQNDLDVIRIRAGLGKTTANTKEDLIDAILEERRKELFTEWGHRWFDLIRTEKTDAVLSLVKGSKWQATDVLYPIPATETRKDPNLKQNPGY